MKRLLKNLFTAVRLSAPRAANSLCHRARPSVEWLESRLALSVTDMTQLAKLFPPHNGPTHLYLNFDGYAAKGVSAFTGGSKSEEEIVFRSSEIFAPFNVEVSRAIGDGNFVSTADGHTTVFIGDNSGFKDGNGHNVPGGVTPGASVDYPGQLRGDTHALNSDPYDIAYVDPVGLQLPNQQVTIVWNNAQIADAVAHEAGHTFGLAHVLGGQTNDVMSYNSNDWYFADKALPVTNLNYDPKQGKAVPSPGLQPSWQGSAITTQDSFTALQTELGSHPLDNEFHVVHTGSIDTNAYQYIPFAPTLWLGQKASDSIHRPGDFDVYYLTADQTQTVAVDVAGGVPGFPQFGLTPVLLAYDLNGNLLPNGVVEPGLSAIGAPVHVQASFSLTANHNYLFVVGGMMGASTGSYSLTLTGTGFMKVKPMIPALAGAGSGAAAASICFLPAAPFAATTPATFTAARVNSTWAGTPATGTEKGAAKDVGSTMAFWLGPQMPTRMAQASGPGALDQVFANGLRWAGDFPGLVM